MHLHELTGSNWAIVLLTIAVIILFVIAFALWERITHHPTQQYFDEMERLRRDNFLLRRKFK